MKKRLLSMILAISMMLTILPVNAITAWAADDGMSGNCGKSGDNVTYNLTQNNDDDADKTYTLTISGNGEMKDYSVYSYNNSPWQNKESAITQVVFEGDITTIGNYSFYRCTRLTSITIPNSVISIGADAFLDCTGLKEIKMPDDSNSKLQSIGDSAFGNCSNLTSITIPSSVQSIGHHAFYLSVGSLKVYWPTVLSDRIKVDDDLDGGRVTYYYPGYKSAWDVQKSKISNFRGLDDVRYYCDITIDANGGSFSDGTKTKVVKKVWSKENLTQEQVEAIGVPKNAQKAFYGWKYIGFYTEHTDNLEDVVIKDSMTFYADYTGNTVTLGQLNNGNEPVKGNSYEFTVTINTYCADSGSPIKKLTFGDVAGTIKYKNGKAVGAEGLEVTLPDGGEEKTLTFTFTPNEVGQNQTLTASLDGLKYKEEEYGPVTSSTTYSVRDRQNAEVTITGLDNTTVKAGEAKEFTVSVTPNDDTIDNVTFGTTSGEVQWSNDGGNTWTTVPSDVAYSGLTGKKFRVVPAADAANGTVTVTVTAKKADGTEIAKTATFTVTAREHATVAINELNGKTITQNKAHTFTVTVTAHDDSDNATLTFDNVAGLTYNGTAVTDAGVTVTLTKNQSKTLNFTLTPSEAGNKTLTATLSTSGATDTAIYTVSEYEHAKVTIDGLDTDLKQGESKDFTVKVDPKDDSGDATIDFGNKNSEIQYKDGEDWKSMPSDGLKIDLNNGKKPYDFRITPKNDGSQTLTATVKKENTKLGEAEKSYNVSKYVDAVVKIDGLSGTVETDTEKEFTVTVTANDDAGKNVTAKAGFTGPAGATITLKKVQYRFGDSGEWQELNGMNLDINSLELPFTSLRNITYKLTVTFAEAGNYQFDVSLTKKDAAEAFTSDSAEVTVTKKEEPVTPGSGSTGGGENPGENPGGNPGSGSTKPEQETPKRKLEIADGTLTSVTVKDENGNLKDITDTITKDLDGKYEIPVGATVTVTAKDAPEGMKFGEWSISDKTLLGDPDVPYTEKDLIFTMPDNSDGVKLSVVYLEESIGEEPNLVEKGALAGTVVVGSAALLYQGHMLGTELYLRYLLPHGAVIPQNRAELAVLLWQDAENPEPVSTTLYSDISDEDSAIQQAARWAVENDLMEQLDAEEHPDHFDPFVPVTFSDSIRAWKKAQELKKSVH